MNKVLANPAFLQKLADTGAEPMPGTPQAFAAYIRADRARMAKVVKESGAKLD